MRTTIIALVLAFSPGFAAAQNKDKEATAAQKEQAAQHARAVARCKAARGVDCDTAQGLQEWLLQERSRDAATREGSRATVRR